MALNIRSPRAERLARELAVANGESLTNVVITALEAQLVILKRRARAPIDSSIAQLQDFLASQPDRDTRSAEEILGYDAFGIPA